MSDLEMKIEAVKEEVTACYRSTRTMLIIILGFIIFSAMKLTRVGIIT